MLAELWTGRSGLYKVQWDTGEAFTSKQTSQHDTQRLGVYIAPFLIGNLWDVKKILGTLQFMAFSIVTRCGGAVWVSGLDKGNQLILQLSLLIL